MTTILNLTQHTATADQASVGVVEPADKKAVQELLTFNTLPTGEVIADKAERLAKIAQDSGFETAMIGGAGYLMGALENALKKAGIKPVHAFTVRSVVETIKDDGTVEKTAVFKHAGFIEV